MIIIGDVHGEYNMLMGLLNKLPQTDDLCFVGDLIDRGPDSKKVVDFVRNNGHLTVIGNHEDMIEDVDLWISNGGMKTIDSFGGVDNIIDLIEWTKTLPITIEFNVNEKRYIISHSYLRNGIETAPHDVIWGRLFPDKEMDFINIFGHTPVKNVKKIHNKHWNIDTGATFKSYGYGTLSAIDLNDEKIYTFKDDNNV